MEIKGIGIDIADARVQGDPQRLETEMDCLRACGFEAVELTTSGFFVVRNGKLDQRQADSLLQVLGKFPFRYTLHAPDCLNLAVSPYPELERQIFSSCLEFARLAGAEVLVYHCGQEFLRLSEGREREKAVGLERRALRELAEEAKAKNIMIAVENADPVDGEAELLAARAGEGNELRALHPSLYLELVGQTVLAARSQNVGLTLDLGHLFLASRLTGMEFLDSIAAQAALVRHLHLHDNFGRLPASAHNEMERAVYGEGDCHLPPGLGAIPIREALGLLGSFNGFIILEIKPQYRSCCREALSRMRSLLETL